VKFRQNTKLKFKKKGEFGGFSITRSDPTKNKENLPDSYIWFSLCSQKYKKMIKDL
jgi:hypothetical protein